MIAASYTSRDISSQFFKKVTKESMHAACIEAKVSWLHNQLHQKASQVEVGCETEIVGVGVDVPTTLMCAVHRKLKVLARIQGSAVCSSTCCSSI